MNKALILLCTLLFIGCTKEKPVQLQSRTFFRMSTVVTITIADTTETSAAIWEGCDSILKAWDEQFSPEIEGSEIQQLLHRQHDTVSISPELYTIIQKTTALSSQIDTLFDLTILPVKLFWQPENSCDTCNLPSPDNPQSLDSLRAIMASVGMDKISLLTHSQIAFATRKTSIDVGGVAKGYAIMALRDFLLAQGIKNFLINGGGDVLAHGTKGDEKPFIVGVQHPRNSEALLATLPLTNSCIMTSGDYERFRITPEGKRVHHIFDARTGLSATQNQSVTIIHPDPLVAKILSPGLFTLTPEEMRPYIQQFPGLAVMTVDSAGVVWKSENFPQ